MRMILVLAGATMLTACGGAGVQTAGSAIQTGSGTGSTTPANPHTFVNPTDPKTYSAIGGIQHYDWTVNDVAGSPDQQYAQLYAANASTARDSGITVTYNPRDAIFDLVIKDNKAIVSHTLRFQDPVHRTAFGGQREPQAGVPDLTSDGVVYLQAGGADSVPVYDPASSLVPIGNLHLQLDRYTFFYQKPGTTTKYVTFAGYVRNSTHVTERMIGGFATGDIAYDNMMERGAFVFGERTATSAIPRTGTGTFNGQMLATMVYNPLLDTDARTPTYFQWINGTANTKVNFGTNTFTIDLAGKVGAPAFDLFTNRNFVMKDGATFNASGAGRIDMINIGGFAGNFSNAYFIQPDGTRVPLVIAGSSVDGTFYGPAADEVGGGFRIVGGNPDERIDILGAFTGKK